MNGGPAQVLGALRDAGERPVSGEDLSAVLGVSRAQVWKHVEALRKRGYEIEGEPGGGYRLSSRPDCLYPEEIACGLETRWLAHQIEYFESTDSTNRVAFDLGRAGEPHGTAVIAESQTAGRGRLGRSFHSPPRQNFYTSLVLRPALTIAEAPTLILAAAVAVADSVAETVGNDEAVEIKWPNDVLLGGLKTSGILMEMSGEATRVSFIVLGIGVNLNVDRGTFPEEFRARATSLASYSGRPVDRIAFAQRLYRHLEDALDLHDQGGFEALRPRFEARFKMRNQHVRVVQMDGSALSGTALGVARDGSLEIERSDGVVERVVAGDVTIDKNLGPTGSDATEGSNS